MNTFFKAIVLILFAASIDGVAIATQSEDSESTESHTSDVSCDMETLSTVDASDKLIDNMKSSRSGSVSPRLEMYGIYVVDGSYKELTKKDIVDKDNFSIIEIPLSIEKISEDTFEGCTHLRKAIIPATCYKNVIGAFAKINDRLERIHVVGCNDKKHVERIKKSLENEYGFDKKSIIVDVKGEYTFDTSLPGLGCHIPVSCADYDTIVINGVAQSAVDSKAFETTPNLTHITLPNSITQVAVSAFDACKKLKSIKLPKAAYNSYVQTFADKGFVYVRQEKNGTYVVEKR